MTRIRKINQSQVEGSDANQNDANEIRPLGEMAVYVGQNDKLELLMFDGTRTHVKSKVLSKGTFYGGDADSGDGEGYDTIKLIPDAVLHVNDGSYGNDQYIVIDPTNPNHIHVRAGGAIDSSTADLFLGGEENNVSVSDGGNTVVISTAGTHNWQFGADGDLSIPSGKTIRDAMTGNDLLAGGTAADVNIWVQTFETVVGAPTDIVAVAASVEYDSAGNVIALFVHLNNNDNSRYYSVGKYTTTGAKIWTARFADGFTTDGWGLAVDNDSDSIYVAGESEAEGGQYNATLTKIDATDGSIIWSKTYDFGFSSQSSVVDVAADGSPVMVGYASNGTDDYITTTKVDAADGSIIWTRSLDGQADEQAYGMAVGPSGEVVAIGYMDQLGEEGDTDDHMLVVKYDSAGVIQWQKAILFDVGFDCRGADADIDSDGNIYVTGNYQYVSDDAGTTSALSILKLDGTGAKQWSRRVVGDCDTFGTSVVVGPDDKLYLSGLTGNNNDVDNAFTWVAAKYGFDGTVEWQRLIDNTTGWTFVGGIFFSNNGGSNLAVKDGYVVLAGGFGDLINSGDPRATVVQVESTGDVFSIGDWDFKAASFSGVLSADASDITVVNAEKTDTDNSENVAVTTAELATDVSGFLLGTLYAVGDSSDRLVNGEYEIVLGENGTVTLPAGGTITEGVVTSNPTIQLTPASPEVASQKLVIKGGGNYSNTENGITVTLNNITQIVGDVVNVFVEAPTRVGQTLYWWIYPESAGLADPGTGTVILDEMGDGLFTFTLDSDDYEFTVRVSPEEDNYDPASVGVESGLINADAPTFSEHHLHLTTGNLAVTSIFLGTDDHNVRTTTDGKIQITTPNETNNVWEFGTDGITTLPSSLHFGSDSFKIEQGQGSRISSEVGLTLIARDTTDPENPVNRNWEFGTDGSLTIPGAVVNSTVAKTGGTASVGAATAIIVTNSPNPNWTAGTGVAANGINFVIAVDGSGNATVTTINDGGTGHYIGETFGPLPGSALGGTDGVDDVNFEVTAVDLGTTTAIDLTKSVNKLADGNYTLADGTEGQIMYLVRQNGSTAANIIVQVASGRIDGNVFLDNYVYPFQIPFIDMITIIFTDDAWQASTMSGVS